MSQQLELLTESPSQWTTVCFVTPEIQKKEIKPFVIHIVSQVALKELEGTPDERTSSLVNADKFSAVRAVVRHVGRLRSAARGPWQPDDVRLFLEGLKFSPECVSELTALLCTDHIYSSVPQHARVKPALEGLTWRIDLSLSQSNATSDCDPQRIKEILHRDTHIILTLSLSHGQTRTYRLSINKFHELRFVVASALKSLIVLEKRKCMRKD